MHRGSRSQRPDMAVAVVNVGVCGASGCHAYSRGCALGFALAWCPKDGEEADGGWCCDERQAGLTCCGYGSRHLVPVMATSIYCAWGQRSPGPWQQQWWSDRTLSKPRGLAGDAVPSEAHASGR